MAGYLVKRSATNCVWQKLLSFAAIVCLTVHASTTNNETKDPNAHNGTTVKPPDWSYEDETNWTSHFEACNGHHQSPIAIDSSSCLTNLTCDPFQFNQGYRRSPSSASVINTGHTAQITISENATISGGPLPAGNYIFVQMHFHWGGNDSLGSEHTLDGVRYPLELHLVHHHENYSSINEALGKKGAVVVLGVWFELNDVGTKRGNEIIQPLVKAFGNVKNKGETDGVKGQRPLYDFLPEKKDTYFHYDGSLTTPSCVENVMWVIFKSKQFINHVQLEAFRSLQEESYDAITIHHLENNFRHLQPLYDRTVYLVSSSYVNSPTSLLVLIQLVVNAILYTAN